MDYIKSQIKNDDQDNSRDFLGFIPLDQMEEVEKISFGVQSLDKLTRGGIELSTVTQFYGVGGSGKTQICLQLAVNVQLPPIQGQCIYIAAGKSFAASRIFQIIKELKKRTKNRDIRSIDFLGNIHVLMAYSSDIFKKFVNDPDELESFLETSSTNVKLLIIDSIADIYGSDHDFKDRATGIRASVTKLLDLAMKYKFAIVSTNHAVDVFEDEDDELDESSSRLSDIKPALGLVWNSFVSTTFEVTRTDYDCETAIRQLKLIESSSALPLNTEKFIITEKGLKNLTS